MASPVVRPFASSILLLLLLLGNIISSNCFQFSRPITTTPILTTRSARDYNPTQHNQQQQQPQAQSLLNPNAIMQRQHHTSPRYHHFKQTRRRNTNTSLSLSISSTIYKLQILEPILQNKSNQLCYSLFSMLFLSAAGIMIEDKYKIGKALSAPLVTMALGLMLSNIGVLPFSSPIYAMINRHLVALAIPLLLFDSDLRRVIKETGSLLLAFFVGTCSTIIGTILTSSVLPLGENGWKIACALASRHIGGAINFVAVAETLQISGTYISAAIAADNIVVALYFILLFSLSKPGEDAAVSPNSNNREEVVSLPLEEEDHDKSSITLSSISTSLAISSGLVVVSNILTQLLFPNKSMSSLPLLSLLTVTSATTFPTFFSSLRTTGTSLGILFMQMFFAASGASSSIKLVIQSAPTLFVYSFLQISLHFICLVGIGKYIFKLPSRELFLASNANVGGPTTAAAMAKAKDWNSLVLPALLIGILGYAIATPIGLALGPLLMRLPRLL